MKLRIQDNSIRFRVTLKEVESLLLEGSIERRCELLGTSTAAGLRYAVVLDPALKDSATSIEAASITLRLSPGDLATLTCPTEEGIYLKREWRGADGAERRCMVSIEKDRPASTCKKIESWIYEGHQGVLETRRPIPGKAS